MDAFEHVSQRIDDIYKVRKCPQVDHLLVFVTLAYFKVNVQITTTSILITQLNIQVTICHEHDLYVF